ncbi:hypothetical protein [Flavobacterium sp. 3HN19-14]|uniref:hypothetical protein n=1 Tax=Flavobacterium sp. 3HN19-14 TaxID=3448133 RepID=UPI003EE02EA0
MAPINYAKIIVNGTNVSNGSSTSGIKFQSGGSFTVNNNAVFKLKNNAGFTGSTTTGIDTVTNGGPSITLATGSKIEYTAVNPNIQTITPFASYSDVGISGTGKKILGTPDEVLVGRDLSITAGTLEIAANRLLTVTNAIASVDDAITVKDSGSLVQINDGVTDTGLITAIRTSRSMAANDYIYWGSPVVEDVFSQIPSSFDYTYTWQTGGAYDGAWVGLESTTAGKGFITRINDNGAGSASFYFNGTPNNGTINVAAQSYDSGGTPQASGNTVLLANPYPCALDATTFVNTNSSSIEGTLYFWTSTTPLTNWVYTANDYASWNKTGGTTTGGSALTPTGKIGCGQGFLPP